MPIAGVGEVEANSRIMNPQLDFVQGTGQGYFELGHATIFNGIVNRFLQNPEKAQRRKVRSLCSVSRPAFFSYTALPHPNCDQRSRTHVPIIDVDIFSGAIKRLERQTPASLNWFLEQNGTESSCGLELRD
jgi:hypothetical protein